MNTTINKNNLHLIKNLKFLQYAKLFTAIEKNTIENLKSFGIPLELEKPRNPLLKENSLNANYENNNKSISINNLSPACIACRKGDHSYTSFVSLKCHRDCYFCFNENQDNYDLYINHKKDLINEINHVLKEIKELKYFALTGGEPLLFEKEVIDCLHYLNEISPQTHTRLYTTGDLLTKANLEQMKAANLDEIRISIKMDDSQQRINFILNQLRLAKEYIPAVMVEMPIIPNTENEMKQLLLDLEDIGIFGINLLEFCYPLKDPAPFVSRGFELKNPPYETYYNFWYAGGLAIAKSEDLCLELVQFAIDNNFKMGVHYCSLENKFTGQVYQQNKDSLNDPLYEFSNIDFFYKTAKVFGKDVNKVVPIFNENKIHYVYNEDFDFIQFAPSSVQILKDLKIEVAITSVIVEPRNTLKEVKIELFTSDSKNN